MAANTNKNFSSSTEKHEDLVFKEILFQFKTAKECGMLVKAYKNIKEYQPLNINLTAERAIKQRKPAKNLNGMRYFGKIHSFEQNAGYITFVINGVSEKAFFFKIKLSLDGQKIDLAFPLNNFMYVGMPVELHVTTFKRFNPKEGRHIKYKSEYVGCHPVYFGVIEVVHTATGYIRFFRGDKFEKAFFHKDLVFVNGEKICNTAPLNEVIEINSPVMLLVEFYDDKAEAKFKAFYVETLPQQKNNNFQYLPVDSEIQPVSLKKDKNLNFMSGLTGFIVKYVSPDVGVVQTYIRGSEHKLSFTKNIVKVPPEFRNMPLQYCLPCRQTVYFDVVTHSHERKFEIKSLWIGRKSECVPLTFKTADCKTDVSVSSATKSVIPPVQNRSTNMLNSATHVENSVATFAESIPLPVDKPHVKTETNTDHTKELTTNVALKATVGEKVTSEAVFSENASNVIDRNQSCTESSDMNLQNDHLIEINSEILSKQLGTVHSFISDELGLISYNYCGINKTLPFHRNVVPFLEKNKNLKDYLKVGQQVYFNGMFLSPNDINNFVFTRLWLNEECDILRLQSDVKKDEHIDVVTNSVDKSSESNVKHNSSTEVYDDDKLKNFSNDISFAITRELKMNDSDLNVPNRNLRPNTFSNWIGTVTRYESSDMGVIQYTILGLSSETKFSKNVVYFEKNESNYELQTYLPVGSSVTFDGYVFSSGGKDSVNVTFICRPKTAHENNKNMDLSQCIEQLPKNSCNVTVNKGTLKQLSPEIGIIKHIKEQLCFLRRTAFLYGIPLQNYNLEDVFELGGEVQYTYNSETKLIIKVWLGSEIIVDKDKSFLQLITYCGQRKMEPYLINQLIKDFSDIHLKQVDENNTFDSIIDGRTQENLPGDILVSLPSEVEHNKQGFIACVSKEHAASSDSFKEHESSETLKEDGSSHLSKKFAFPGLSNGFSDSFKKPTSSIPPQKSALSDLSKKHPSSDSSKKYASSDMFKKPSKKSALSDSSKKHASSESSQKYTSSLPKEPASLANDFLSLVYYSDDDSCSSREPSLQENKHSVKKENCSSNTEKNFVGSSAEIDSKLQLSFLQSDPDDLYSSDDTACLIESDYKNKVDQKLQKLPNIASENGFTTRTCENPDKLIENIIGVCFCEENEKSFQRKSKKCPLKNKCKSKRYTSTTRRMNIINPDFSKFLKTLLITKLSQEESQDDSVYFVAAKITEHIEKKVYNEVFNKLLGDALSLELENISLHYSEDHVKHKFLDKMKLINDIVKELKSTKFPDLEVGESACYRGHVTYVQKGTQTLSSGSILHTNLYTD